MTAVVGSCAPERARYAEQLARATDGVHVSARRLSMSPDPLDEACSLAPWANTPAGAVIEFPTTTIMTELIGTLADPAAHLELAAIVCVVDGATQERPGWVGQRGGDSHPHITDRRVTGPRYEHLRPLHSQRLQTLLDDRIQQGEFGTVLRSAGFCHFATRPGIAGEWNHVGSMISFEPLFLATRRHDADEVLAIGQDLALFGLDLDVAALTARSTRPRSPTTSSPRAPRPGPNSPPPTPPGTLPTPRPTSCYACTHQPCGATEPVRPRVASSQSTSSPGPSGPAASPRFSVRRNAWSLEVSASTSRSFATSTAFDLARWSQGCRRRRPSSRWCR